MPKLFVADVARGPRRHIEPVDGKTPDADGAPTRRRDFIMLIGAGALIWPRGLRAQQKPVPVIGFLGTALPPEAFMAALKRGLSEAGYTEGQSVAIEYRWSEGRPDRVPILVADLVARKVEVIVTAGASALATAAKNATSTVPIVFVTGADPVAAGLIASLSRPGGNLTGATFQSNELMPKRVELLSELVPEARLVALLVNPNAPESSNEAFIRDTREAARAKGMELDVLKAGTESEIDAAFTTLVQLKLDALLVAPDGFFPTRSRQIAALASRYAVPVVYSVREYPDAGGLISYGSTLPGTAYQAGIYVGKILKGTKPADLPVQQPTTFELVVNLKTAKELGLTIPPSILARADEVIE